jgi:thiol:disulfide interchange protein DsbD
VNYKIIGFISVMLFTCHAFAVGTSPPWPEQGQQSGEFSLNSSSNSSNLANTLELAPQLEFLAVEEAYQASLEVDDNGVLTLNWVISDGYYLYRHEFKLTAYHQGETHTLNAQYPAGKTIYDPTFEQELEVYYHQVSLPIDGKQSSDTPYKVKVRFQGCADAGLCYAPESYWFKVDPVNGSTTPIAPPAPQSSTSSSAVNQPTLWLALVSALLGGLILNLMPCVFPVLSIKALSSAEAQQNPHTLHRHGWSYTAGGILSFIAIAGLMLALKASGQAIGWGFQLQSPIFVGLLTYLFFSMGLSLSGFTDFGSRLMGVGHNLSIKSGYQGSFFSGVLASVVASPCTAPFMGAALGYALGQPAYVALLVFATLGLGMAVPFLMLSYIPSLGKRLPKPGQWMATLKQALAFPLYLAAIWLIWVLGRQSGGDAMAIILSGLLLIVFALWLQHKYQHPLAKLLSIGFIVTALALSALIHPNIDLKSDKQGGVWQRYSDQKLQTALEDNRSVFINATADWCLTCLANEKIAFSEAFYQQLKHQNTLALKADWTNYNPEITRLLNQYGRSGVPLYLYIENGQTRILPQLLSKTSLLTLTLSRKNEK